MNVMDKYDNILIEYKEQIKKLQEKNAILKIELQEIKEDIKKYTAPKSNNHKKEKIQCVKKRINCEEEIIYNQSRIIIFDTNVVKNKKFIGFQGYGCNVKLCIGRIQIECYDHEISCYLVQSQIHNIELIIQPYENIMDIRYNQTRHQYKNSECGVYSVNFILRLLKGDSFDKITNSPVNEKKNFLAIFKLPLIIPAAPVSKIL